VPCIIGARGVEKVVEIKLDRQEKAMFTGSVQAVRALIKITRGLMTKSSTGKGRSQVMAKKKKAAKKKKPARRKAKKATKKRKGKKRR
jgi:malate dehydrogenase